MNQKRKWFAWLLSICSAMYACPVVAAPEQEKPSEPALYRSGDVYPMFFQSQPKTLEGNPIPEQFVIERAEVNIALTPMDGPYRHLIQGKVVSPGLFIFTFENQDGDFIYEVKKYRVTVLSAQPISEMAVNGIILLDDKIILSPYEEDWKKFTRGRITTKPNNVIEIRWETPFREVGSWKLTKIEYIAPNEAR